MENNDLTENTTTPEEDQKKTDVKGNKDKKTIDSNDKFSLRFIIITIISCIVCFAAGFFITIAILNNENYYEDTSIYVIENMNQESDNTYLVEYYDAKQSNQDSKDVIEDTFDIEEFLEPESENIGVSYLRIIKRSDNSFLNSLFHYNDSVETEYKFYITELDKLKLEENGTTDVLDLYDIINLTEEDE